MKITPTQRFRDGRTTYEEGQEYDVPDLDGARMVGAGFATSPDYAIPGTRFEATTVEMRPDSVTHKAAAKQPKEG